jgi:hypothetical protein
MALTRSERLAQRRYQNLLLSRIKLPDTNKDDLRAIVPELYYVVWEKSLYKPKIFRYSFASEYFAKLFCERKIEGLSQYNIITGQDLLDFGITHARTRLRNVEISGIGESQIKYNYPDGISAQNKKTLRTLYRRNTRRLLSKTIKKKDKRNGR